MTWWGTYVHSLEWVRCKQNGIRAYVHMLKWGRGSTGGWWLDTQDGWQNKGYAKRVRIEEHRWVLYIHRTGRGHRNAEWGEGIGRQVWSTLSDKWGVTRDSWLMDPMPQAKRAHSVPHSMYNSILRPQQPVHSYPLHNPPLLPWDIYISDMFMHTTLITPISHLPSPVDYVYVTTHRLQSSDICYEICLCIFIFMYILYIYI